MKSGGLSITLVSKMRIVFAAARFLPYWALGFALVFAELARINRQRARRGTWIYLLMGGGLTVSTVVWFYYRGYAHSDEWVRLLFPGS